MLDEHQKLRAHMRLLAQAEQLAKKSEALLKQGKVAQARTAFHKAEALLAKAKKLEQPREYLG